MSVILGKSGSLKFSRPTIGSFLTPEAAIIRETSHIAIQTETWYPGDPVWLIHASLSYKASIIKGYASNNKEAGKIRIHSNPLGCLNDLDETAIDLSEVTVGPFAVLSECNSFQFGLVYLYLKNYVGDVLSPMLLVDIPLLGDDFYSKSSDTTNKYVYQADVKSWTLDLTCPSIDTHSLGERFKTVSKDTLSGAGTIAFNIDFSSDINKTGTELFLDLMAVFTDKPDATARLYLNDVGNEAIANRDQTGTRLDGDLYYETDVLFTSINIESQADNLMVGSVSYVCTGPIKLQTDVNIPDTFENESVEIQRMPYAWASYTFGYGSGGNDYAITTAAVDKFGNSFQATVVQTTEYTYSILLIKRDQLGNTLFTKYLACPAQPNNLHSVINNSGNLVLMIVRGDSYNQHIFLQTYRPDGTFYNEKRIYVNETFVYIGTINVNPVTGYLYITYSTGVRGGPQYMLIFDEESNYIKRITFARMNFWSAWSFLYICGVTYDEMGNVTVAGYGYEGDTDYAYQFSNQAFNYVWISKVTSDGIFIHAAARYGTLDNTKNQPGTTDLALASFSPSSDGGYFLNCNDRTLRLDSNFVPIDSKVKINMAGIEQSMFRRTSSYMLSEDEVTIGNNVVLNTKKFNIQRQKVHFYADQYRTLGAMNTLYSQETNRAFLPVTGASAYDTQSTSGLVSASMLNETDIIGSVEGYKTLFKGYDSNTNWGGPPFYPREIDDAEIPPFTQSLDTDDLFGPFPTVTVIAKPEGVSTVYFEYETISPVQFALVKTPDNGIEGTRLFRFTYDSTRNTLLPGQISYWQRVPGAYSFPGIRLNYIDADGKNCKDVMDNLVDGSICLMRNTDNSFSCIVPSTLDRSHSDRITMTPYQELTNFPFIDGATVYFAVTDGMYDPRYPYSYFR